MKYINRDSKVLNMVKERSQSILEVLKYSFGYFLAQFTLVFAVMFTLALFEPVNGFFAVPIDGYIDAAKIGAVIGMAGGLVGFLSALDKKTDAEIDFMLLPNTVKEVSGQGNDQSKVMWVSKRLGLYVKKPTSWKAYFQIWHF